MIEQIIQLYPGNGQKLRILDIGTGSGCILLALLSCFLFSVGVGVDCSKNAVSMARTNALALALHRRSDFFCLDWNVDSMEHLGRFDLIASNPPYIPESCINTLDPEVAYWDPNVALNGGKDGLGAYRVLLPICMALMKKEGILALEIGKSQAAQVIHLAKTIGLSYVNSGYDLQKIERIVVFQLN
jgi:release factor glutamine methyltransferase